MIPDCTPAVTRACQASRQWAAALAGAELRPCHLLLGLLDEEEGRASVLLTRSGLDHAAYRAAWETRRATTTPDSPPVPVSPAVWVVLDGARGLARTLTNEREVGSEHLLLAVLREDQESRRELESFGLDWAQLEALFVPRQEPPLEAGEVYTLQPTECVETSRILDAGANRAREALRVVEDYCRFVLDDAFLSGELKQLRHDLASALGRLPERLLLEARETEQDVGTGLFTEREGERSSPQEVARVNCKRLQEALRSLEEYGKVYHPELGRAVEALRYRSYTVERVLLLGVAARHKLADARLYVLLTASQCQAALDWTIAEAAAGGAGVFQLREKNLSDRALLERARQVRQWTRQAGALFILNDRPDLARLAEADGVHLGQDDLPVKDARRVLGPGALIGVSTHNLDQVRRALRDGASYLGVGPAFPSGTKSFTEFPGLEFVRQASEATTLPAFVLGGVTPDNVARVAAAGGTRVAVSQAIAQSENPRAAAATLVRCLPER